VKCLRSCYETPRKYAQNFNHSQTQREQTNEVTKDNKQRRNRSVTKRWILISELNLHLRSQHQSNNVPVRVEYSYREAKICLYLHTEQLQSTPLRAIKWCHIKQLLSFQSFSTVRYAAGKHPYLAFCNKSTHHNWRYGNATNALRCLQGPKGRFKNQRSHCSEAVSNRHHAPLFTEPKQ